jgi:hypothetical protein
MSLCTVDVPVVFSDTRCPDPKRSSRGATSDTAAHLPGPESCEEVTFALEHCREIYGVPGNLSRAKAISSQTEQIGDDSAHTSSIDVFAGRLSIRPSMEFWRGFR